VKSNDKNKYQKKLEENVEIVSSRSTSDVAEQKFINGRERLFTLLTDHPHFQKKLKTIRKKYSIPESGFVDLSKAFQWEHKSKIRYHRYVKEISSLISDFNIPKVFRGSVNQFVYDCILIPKRTQNQKIADYPIFSIIHTDEDRDINKYLINPNSLYIELFEWTTKRDIEKALKKLSTLKKNKKPFQVSKVSDLTRKVWLLSQEGLNDKEIRERIQDIFANVGGVGRFDYHDVPIYRKRYKDALRSLRKLF
jgi:hypothetical protein